MLKTKGALLLDPFKKGHKKEIEIDINNLEESKSNLPLEDLLNRKKRQEQALSPHSMPQEGQGEISIESIDTSGLEFEVVLRPGEKPPEVSKKKKLLPKPQVTQDLTKTPKIQPRVKKLATEPQSTQPVVWNLGELDVQKDSLALGLQNLFSAGAYSILFLAIQSDSSDASIPHFLSAATVKPQERLLLWTGLKWDPRIVPEVWNLFVKTGFVEFSPPGTMTNIMSNRNVIRGAFGINQNEWLALLRVGELAACRGVLAVISAKSVRPTLIETLALMNKPSLRKAA